MMERSRFPLTRLFAQRAWVTLLLLSLASCLGQAPKQQALLNAGGQEDGGGGGTETLADFGDERNFFHYAGVRVFDTLTVPLDEEATFMLWGKQVQARVAALPADAKVCLMVQYKHKTPSPVLVLSAVRRRQVVSQSASSATVTYHWLLYPNDVQRNQQDCLTTGIMATKTQLYGAGAPLKFGIADLCQDCAGSTIGENLAAYFDSGSAVGSVDLSALKLRLQPVSTTGGGGSLSCSAHSACTAQGYSCCLDGQCVVDKAIKNGVDQSSSGFLSALADVQNNPARYSVYPHYFYICPQSTGGGSSDPDPVDADFEALKRLNELRDLHQCLNAQWDEMGYCAVRTENASALISSGVPANRVFSARKDDNNFSWTGNALSANSLYEIRYGEQVLYREGLAGSDSTTLNGSHQLLGTGNADLTNAQTAEVTKTATAALQDDTLVLRYKMDATCERLTSSLARCRKTYVQGQVSTPPRPTDHANSPLFKLPSYANLAGGNPPAVKIGGTNVAASPSTWVVSGQNINFIMPVTTNQTVEITYYVTSNVSHLLAGRDAAQARVNAICECNEDNCNLKPKTKTVNGVTSIVDYECLFTGSDEGDGPLHQVVYLNSKTVPSRYYDVNGVVWDGDSGATAPAQEGLEFNYTNSDAFKPNNASAYVGFHEIYGSFNKQATAPRAPAVVTVQKDRTYDIYVDSGGVTNCANCGNDPYQPLLKLFPQTFTGRGGGYQPNLRNASRTSSSAVYRADDLLFGRACFVPATMLPWSHATGSDLPTQRKRRLAAQHFYYANGYQRDWYGFDYGAVIGSYDGVTWFAIGNERRIKATGTKLLLAVNMPFGDLSESGSLKVVVSENAVVDAGSNVDHDTESDGAECQKNHFCSSDDDCLRQLGYDYSCQTVTGITSPWPRFDNAGNEYVASESRTLISLLGGANGQSKRCVYRGRGAPCAPDLASLGSTYNGTSLPGLAACSPNHYCARLDGGSRFNTAISRWARSPESQNLLGDQGVRDTVGLGARVVGRPQDYYGTKSPASINSSAWGFGATNLRDHLMTSVGVQAVCLPGRDVASTTYGLAHSRIPSASDKEAADRMFGVGPTVKLTSAGTKKSSTALAFCPATEAGTYIHHTASRSTQASVVAVAQNIPTAVLDMTEFSALNLLNTSAGSAATAVGYQRHACLRAPGAPCFSDLECAPAPFVANKMKTLGDWGGFANNTAEQNFWKEDLTCGNPEPTKLYDSTLNASFDAKSNKCCRMTGKTIQVYSQYDQDTSFTACVAKPGGGRQPAIAGVTTDFNSTTRYTRNHTVFDQVSCVDPTAPSTQSFPALVVPTARTVAGNGLAVEFILNQYKTLDLMNSRTCCTGHWVRSFASENGGGHTWGEAKSQSIAKDIFYAWNWFYDQKFSTLLDETENLACSNTNFGTLSCEIRNLSEAQGNTYLKWIDRFELVGIPQVLIPFPSDAGVEKLVDENQASREGLGDPLDDTLKTPLVEDVSGGGTDYISAASYDKLEIGAGKLKKVFSEKEFNCCVPAGGKVPEGATANTCCTGTLTNQGGPTRCCLGDFADVTVYLNRYVSSEGRGLPDSSYDSETGYIKDPAQVYAIAQAKKLCCSGRLVMGRAISDLYIPLEGGGINPAGKTRRFTYRSDAVDNNEDTGVAGDVYDAGFRWNNHWYCEPSN